VPLETGYYEVYNRDNVELVDINETPIERITPRASRPATAEYEFDIIIYATGFDAITGSLRPIDFRGVDGVRLKDKWKDGPQTYLGVMVEGFPNMLMADGPAHRARQHPAQHRIQRRMGHRPDPLCARHAADAAGGHARRRRRHGPTTSRRWGGLLSNEVNSWMTGINSQRRRQADPHHRPLQRQRARLPRAMRRGRLDLQREVARVDAALRQAAGGEPEARLLRRAPHVAQLLPSSKPQTGPMRSATSLPNSGAPMLLLACSRSPARRDRRLGRAVSSSATPSGTKRSIWSYCSSPTRPSTIRSEQPTLK
jgi:hypothetical protein